MITDNEGFAIPFAEDDQVIECGADDPEFSDPTEWPCWTDSERYKTGPLVIAFEQFNQKLLACGLAEREAEHQAMFCVFRLAGMTEAEARTGASEIFPLPGDG